MYHRCSTRLPRLGLALAWPSVPQLCFGVKRSSTSSSIGTSAMLGSDGAPLPHSFLTASWQLDRTHPSTGHGCSGYLYLCRTLSPRMAARGEEWKERVAMPLTLSTHPGARAHPCTWYQRCEDSTSPLPPALVHMSMIRASISLTRHVGHPCIRAQRILRNDNPI